MLNFLLFFVCLSRIATAWGSKNTVAEEERNHALWLFSNGTIRLDGKEKNLFFKGKKITGMKAIYLFVHKTEHDPTHEHTK